MTTTLQEPENWHLACSTTASFSLSHTTEITLVNFDLPGKLGSFLAKLFRNDATQTMVEIYCRNFIYAHN